MEDNNQSGFFLDGKDLFPIPLSERENLLDLWKISDDGIGRFCSLVRIPPDTFQPDSLAS